MTTKAKTKESEVPAAPVSSAVPPGLNDVRGDEDPVLGQFVEVTSGEYEGRYGVFLELDGSDAVVRTRDAEGERLSVPLSDLRRAVPRK